MSTPITLHTHPAVDPAIHASPALWAPDVPITLLVLADLESPQQPPLHLYKAAAESLVDWQLQHRELAKPAHEMVVSRTALETFTQWYLVKERATLLDSTMQNTIDRTFTTLLAQLQAVQDMPVHGDFAPRQLKLTRPPELHFTAAPSTLSARGPVAYDIATLVRDPALVWDEAFVLDVTIRYWERARLSSLPVGDDFGDFYRTMEWASLYQQLTQMGQLAQSGEPQVPALLDYVCSTCARYIELKPFLRLLERIEGIAAPSGFAFGRV